MFEVYCIPSIQKPMKSNNHGPLDHFFGVKGRACPMKREGDKSGRGSVGLNPDLPYHRSPFRSKRSVSRIHEAKIALK